MRTLILIFVLAAFSGCRGDLALDTDAEAAIGEPAEGEVPAETASESEVDGDGQTVCEVTAEPVRRRTNEEYRFAIEDTFNVSIGDIVEQLPADARVDGFVNTAAALTIDARRIRAYLDVAELITERVDWEPMFDAYAECRSTDATCRDQWITGLGEEMLGELDEGEIDPMRNVFDTAAETSGFEGAAQAVAQAFMVSPQFLYRLEPDTVDGQTLANRLAFLVWQAPAGEWLEAKAAAGELDDADGIAAVVDEMLEDPRARRSLHRFVEDWLNLAELDRQERDESAYPEFSRELADAMARETHHLFDVLVFEEDADLLSALSESRTWIDDPALAELYDFEPGTPGELTEYRFSPDRAGLFGHASVLTLNAQNDHEKIVYRGLYLLETILCGSVGAPNPELLENNPLNIDETASARDRAEARLDANQCAGCHVQFEPLAFAMEPYDAIGAVRTEDEHGHAVRADAELQGPDGTTSYEGVAQLGRLLSVRDDVSRCVAQKGLQFAFGRALDRTDKCVVEDVTDSFEANGRTWRALMKAIATHPSFRAAAPQEELQ